MSKQTTFFNLGKILDWAEQGLTSFSLVVEKRTQKILNRLYKKDLRREALKKRLDKRKIACKKLIKMKDSHVTDRLQELDNLDQKVSQDIEIDKD
ncbi:MAG: hypothetical protein COB12_04745 [Flavobacterium sp.]|nr:MAG: hypothetical protein COB12_04745 [Flavobacterium sp.]